MGDNFNDNLKEARLRSGLSQKEVAENIGVAKSTYSLYESGNREPNVNTIKKIADCLNVSADTLLGLNDELTTLAAHFDGFTAIHGIGKFLNIDFHHNMTSCTAFLISSSCVGSRASTLPFGDSSTQSPGLRLASDLTLSFASPSSSPWNSSWAMSTRS